MSSQLEVEVRWHRACKTSFLAMVDISQHSWSSDHYYVSSSNPHINIIIVFCTRVLVVFLIFFSSEKRFKTQRVIKCCKNLMVSPFSLSPPLGWPGAIRFGLFGKMGGVPLLFWTLDHKPGTTASWFWIFQLYPRGPCQSKESTHAGSRSSEPRTRRQRRRAPPWWRGRWGSCRPGSRRTRWPRLDSASYPLPVCRWMSRCTPAIQSGININQFIWPPSGLPPPK